MVLFVIVYNAEVENYQLIMAVMHFSVILAFFLDLINRTKSSL